MQKKHLNYILFLWRYLIIISFMTQSPNVGGKSGAFFLNFKKMMLAAKPLQNSIFLNIPNE